jgi:VWFA-related protein
LNAMDFEVLDNGKPQAITFFSEEKASAPPPKSSEAEAEKEPASGAATGNSSTAARAVPAQRFVALFIDDTHSGLRSLQTSKVATEKFVASAFQPGDHMAIFTDSGAVTLDFTDNKEQLLAAIGKIKLQSRRGAQAFTDCPALTSYQGYVIANNLDLRAKEIAVAEAEECYCVPPFDQDCKRKQEGFVQDLAQTVWEQTKSDSTTALDVLRIAVQRLAKTPGKRVLIIVSPGFVTGDMEQRTSGIIDAALSGHIVINSLDSEGLLTRGESPEGRKVDESIRDGILPEMMSAAAAATGGQFIRNNNDLTASLRELASAPEVSYLLGFAPANRPDDKYHRLKVRMKNGGDYQIQAREGYYSVVAGKKAETAQQRIDREVAARDELEEIPVEMHVSPGIPKDGQFPIGVVVKIDAKLLKFARMHGRSLQQLTFVTVVVDESGNYVAGKQAVMDLYLKPATLAALEAKGIKAQLWLSAPKGTYRVREVVREMVENHMAALSAPVECR